MLYFSNDCQQVFWINYLFSVCNAGHYKDGGSCLLCPGGSIKSMTGDATNCYADTACDMMTNLPNTGHTACGKFRLFIKKHFNWTVGHLTLSDTILNNLFIN